MLSFKSLICPHKSAISSLASISFLSTRCPSFTNMLLTRISGCDNTGTSRFFPILPSIFTIYWSFLAEGLVTDTLAIVRLFAAFETIVKRNITAKSHKRPLSQKTVLLFLCSIIKIPLAAFSGLNLLFNCH